MSYELLEAVRASCYQCGEPLGSGQDLPLKQGHESTVIDRIGTTLGEDCDALVLYNVDSTGNKASGVPKDIILILCKRCTLNLHRVLDNDEERAS